MQMKLSEDLRAGDFVEFGGFEYEIVAITSFEELLVIYLTPPKDAIARPFKMTVAIPKSIQVMTS